MPKRILVIDDEELVTKSVTRLLVYTGYEVLPCRSGEEAFEKIQKETVDLIVSDIRMPQLNGIEAIQKIRQWLKEHRRKPVPEILITGFADEKMHRQAEALNVADFIYKPFDLRDFLTCVKKNLDTG